MNDPSNVRRPAHVRAAKRPRLVADRTAKPRRPAGVSGWQALEREQFRALIASPRRQDGPEGGSTSC